MGGEDASAVPEEERLGWSLAWLVLLQSPGGMAVWPAPGLGGHGRDGRCCWSLDARCRPPRRPSRVSRVLVLQRRLTTGLTSLAAGVLALLLRSQCQLAWAVEPIHAF